MLWFTQIMRYKSIAPLRRAYFWSLAAWLATVSVFLITLTLPQEDSVSLDPVKASASVSEHSGTFTWYQGEEVAGCSQSPILAFDDTGGIKEAGVEYNCFRTAKTVAGVVHEVASALLIPLAALAFYLGRWRYVHKMPRWRRISVVTLIASLGFILVGWRVPVTAGLVTDHASDAIRALEAGYGELLLKSLFVVGLGGLVGSLATLSTDLFVARLASQTHALTAPTIAERRLQKE